MNTLKKLVLIALLTPTIALKATMLALMGAKRKDIKADLKADIDLYQFRCRLPGVRKVPTREEMLHRR